MAKSMTKSHKYWSYGAFLSMLAVMISGYNGKQRKAHKYLAWGAVFSMFMAVYSGHKMMHRKPKKTEEAAEAEKGE